MVINRGTQISLDLEVAGAEYAPVYKITENIQFDLDQVDRKQWAFEHLIIDPKYEGWLRRRTFIRSGHHTLHLEGNTLTEDQVATILEDADTGLADSGEVEEVRNWNKAMQFIDIMSMKPDIPITSLLIRHVHQLMLGPNDRTNAPGEYRLGDARVRHPVSRKPVYTGPVAGDVPDLMYQFQKWLNNSAPRIYPVLAAGIAHLRLVEIHPFSDGNGRTARALTTLILQRYGYSFNKLLALERYFDLDLVRYCEAIGATVGESFQEGRDLTEWLEYFTSALSVEVSLASDAVIDLRRMMEVWHSKLSEKGYGERHRDILAYALINGSIRPRDVVRIAKVSAVTAGSDLKQLVNAGLLTVKGYGRARVFRPAEELGNKI